MKDIVIIHYEERGEIVMARVIIQVPYNSEKIVALRYCLERNNTSFEDEMEKMIDALYEKCVPKELQDFVEKR